MVVVLQNGSYGSISRAVLSNFLNANSAVETLQTISYCRSLYAEAIFFKAVKGFLNFSLSISSALLRAKWLQQNGTKQLRCENISCRSLGHLGQVLDDLTPLDIFCEDKVNVLC